MQKLIGRRAVQSHFASEEDTNWRLPGHLEFQTLLERGLEVKAHWTGERFWWSRVIYVPTGVAPVALFAETSKIAPRKDRHRIYLADVEVVRMASGESRTVEIVRGGDGRYRTLGIEFPTPRSAQLFQVHLTGLLAAMGIIGAEVGGKKTRTLPSNDRTQHSTPEGLARRVTAQGYPRNGNGQCENP